MFARIMATVTLLVLVATLSAWMLAIWSGDERWYATGCVGLVMLVVAGGVTGAAFEAGEDEW